MPVWAYTLAAHLREVSSLQIALFDNRVQKTDDILAADFFLFTGINQDFLAIQGLHAELKKRFPQAKFIIGGPITWSYDTAHRLSELNFFDHIFIGDGEESLPRFFRELNGGGTLEKVQRALQRFPVGQALPMDSLLMKETIHRYYGAVIEVSRGCPFLCEFCDIRVMPDNNRSHNKEARLIVQEMERMYDLGIRQVLFACDNFIGIPQWAEEVCDQIISWEASSGKKLSLYTWLTINLSNHPRLMKKLRQAGFDMLFIGVESFAQNTLMEMAKIQNTKVELPTAIQTIQSYGLIVVAGLIFGLDTDPDDVFDMTLNGIKNSGLISGDPSLLTALPGTPLYKRMKETGRLREGKFGLGGHKYQTNIRYFKAENEIKDGFIHFVQEFNRGPYQWQRLQNFYQSFERGNYIASSTRGYIDLKKLLVMTLTRHRYVFLFLQRLFRLFCSAERLRFILKAAFLTLQKRAQGKNLWFYFQFWLFNWSNSIMKYADLSYADFNIESLSGTIADHDVLPEGYAEGTEDDIPLSKVRIQRKITSEALSSFLKDREAKLKIGKSG